MIRLTKGTYRAARYACMNFHYARAVPAIQYIYNVWNDDVWCGCIIYSSGANPQIAMPYDKWQGQVLELVRVALNGKQGHGNTSQALSLSLKALHKEAPWIDLVVSYADLDQGHMGILYQATNWVYTGIKNQNKLDKFIVFGKKMHTKSMASKGWKCSVLWLREHVDSTAEEWISAGKHKYLYPMTKNMRKRISVLAEEYPK